MITFNYSEKMTSQDIDSILLSALQGERAKVSERLKQIDEAIKAVKSGKYKPVALSHSAEQLEQITYTPKFKGVSKERSRIEILKAFDTLKEPLKMPEIQEQFKKQTGSDANIREIVRNMGKRGQLKLMKINNSNRFSWWVKSDWVVNGKLDPQYDPQGVYLSFSENEIEFL